VLGILEINVTQNSVSLPFDAFAGQKQLSSHHNSTSKRHRCEQPEYSILTKDNSAP